MGTACEYHLTAPFTAGESPEQTLRRAVGFPRDQGLAVICQDNFAPSDMAEVLREAFELLGPDIVMAHAKDITGDPRKQQQAAGTGRLDWDAYFDCMQAAGFDGPVVLHNLAESQVDESLAFVRRHAGKWYPELRTEERAT